jgi:hypothetical protein
LAFIVRRRFLFLSAKKGPRLGKQMHIHCHNYSTETQELPAPIPTQCNVYTEQCKTGRSNRDYIKFDILTKVTVNNVYMYVMLFRLVGIYGRFYNL